MKRREDQSASKAPGTPLRSVSYPDPDVSKGRVVECASKSNVRGDECWEEEKGKKEGGKKEGEGKGVAVEEKGAADVDVEEGVKERVKEGVKEEVKKEVKVNADVEVDIEGKDRYSTSYYNILGLPESSDTTTKDIDKAYQDLLSNPSSLSHPHSHNQETLHQIHKTLSNPLKRRIYDSGRRTYLLLKSQREEREAFEKRLVKAASHPILPIQIPNVRFESKAKKSLDDFKTSQFRTKNQKLKKDNSNSNPKEKVRVSRLLPRRRLKIDERFGMDGVDEEEVPYDEYGYNSEIKEGGVEPRGERLGLEFEFNGSGSEESEQEDESGGTFSERDEESEESERVEDGEDGEDGEDDEDGEDGKDIEGCERMEKPSISATKISVPDSKTTYFGVKAIRFIPESSFKEGRSMEEDKQIADDAETTPKKNYINSITTRKELSDAKKDEKIADDEETILETMSPIPVTISKYKYDGKPSNIKEDDDDEDDEQYESDEDHEDHESIMHDRETTAEIKASASPPPSASAKNTKPSPLTNIKIINLLFPTPIPTAIPTPIPESKTPSHLLPTPKPAPHKNPTILPKSKPKTKSYKEIWEFDYNSESDNECDSDSDTDTDAELKDTNSHINATSSSSPTINLASPNPNPNSNPNTHPDMTNEDEHENEHEEKEIWEFDYDSSCDSNTAHQTKPKPKPATKYLVANITLSLFIILFAWAWFAKIM